MLKVKNEYAAFCLDETAVYFYLKWEASEKSYNELWKEQSKSLNRIIDKKESKKPKSKKGKKWPST